MKGLYTVINEFLGNRFWSLRRSPIVLLFFLKIISICSLKSNLESKTIPWCLWDSVLWLQFKDGWLVFWSFRLKITSWAYLVGSGLKFIFHWNAQVLILVKSLFNLLADLVIFSNIENSDVSSSNNFALDAKSWDKSFMYIRKSNGPNIEPVYHLVVFMLSLTWISLTLLLRVYCSSKKLLNSSALSLKFEMNLILWNSGGMQGRNVFKSDQ